MPIGAERGALGPAAIGQHGADFGGGREQRGGLGLDDGEIFVLGRRHVLGGAELHHLALGDDRGGVRQNVERVHRADLDHHLEGLAEQEIADQDARLVAPHHARRRLAAAQVALVHHVVVEQRGGVHEFDRRGELHPAVALVAAHAGGGDRQHRPQPLAAGIDQVPGDLGDQADVGAGLGQHDLVDPLHGFAGQADQGLDARRGPFLAFFEGDYDAQNASPDAR